MSAQLGRRGARRVGLDLSPAQLATAARSQERLPRPQRGLRRVVWPGGGVAFHLGHGDWVRVLDANGFVVEALHELYAPPEGETHEYDAIATARWARRWPAEDLWAGGSPVLPVDPGRIDRRRVEQGAERWWERRWNSSAQVRNAFISARRRPAAGHARPARPSGERDHAWPKSSVCVFPPPQTRVNARA